MRTYEEFKKDYDGWKKEDVLNTYYEMLEVFRNFETFIKVKYGDDYLDGWLHYLRTGEIKDEESHEEH